MKLYGTFQCLHLILHNAHFLILPEARVPHLASRVLGLAAGPLRGSET